MAIAPVPGALLALGPDLEPGLPHLDQDGAILPRHPLTGPLVSCHHLGAGKLPLVSVAGAVDDDIRVHRRHEARGRGGAAAMVRTHQHSAGEGAEVNAGKRAGELLSPSLLFQGQQAALRPLLYVTAEQDAMPTVAYLHHATVVVAPRPRPLGPEHAHLQPLPVPALTAATQRSAAREAERGELAAHRHRLQHGAPVARMIPVLVTHCYAINMKSYCYASQSEQITLP